MRKRGGPVGTTLAVSIALALTACVPSPHTVTPTPEATATPVFASDAQALAAAKAAYEGYNAVSDQIAHDGGRNPGRIAKWVSKSWLPTELKGLRSLQNSGEHLVGYTTFRSFTLQTRTQDVRGTTQVGTYACVDVSKTKLRDSSNRNVTPAGRTLILPLELRFESVTAWSTSLVLTESQAWTGQDFCL